MQKEDQLSWTMTKDWKHIMQIQLQLIQNDKKIGTMHINEFPPITQTSNSMCLKCSFAEKSVQHETQGDRK
jgi:hypothetical protein